VKEELKQILSIVKSLRSKYQGSFTLGGNLLGDIGEELVRQNYNVTILKSNTATYDAIELGTNRKIQIKCTMTNSTYFPKNIVPEYFICIQINNDAGFKEIFNGPGQFIMDNYINKNPLKPKKASKDSYYILSCEKLKRKNKSVNGQDRIAIK